MEMRLKNLPKKFEGCWTYSVWSCWASFFEKHVLFYRRSQSSALHWSRLNWPISSEHNHPFFQPHFAFRVGRSYDLDVSQKNGLTFFILEKSIKLFGPNDFYSVIEHFEEKYVSFILMSIFENQQIHENLRKIMIWLDSTLKTSPKIFSKK